MQGSNTSYKKRYQLKAKKGYWIPTVLKNNLKKIGIDIEESRFKKHRNYVSNFYVEDNLDPYKDLVLLIPAVENVLSGSPNNIPPLIGNQKRSWFIKMLQRVCKLAPCRIMNKQYCFPIQISNQPIVLVLQKKRQEGRYLIHYIRLSTYYDFLYTYSNGICPKQLANDLLSIKPFSFWDKRLIQPIDIGIQPIFTVVTTKKGDKILKIFKDKTVHGKDAYHLQFINQQEKVEREGWVTSNSVILAKFVSDTTGRIELIMEIVRHEVAYSRA